MARKKGSTLSGKLGNEIHYTWNGRPCVRSMPTQVANPRTEPQQAHRNAFALVAKLSSYMKEAHLIGLHSLALKEKNSTFALFRRLNKDCCNGGEPDYAHIQLSKGSVKRADINAARLTDGVLTLTFDSLPYGGKPSDEFYLFVYCPDLCTGRLAMPVSRSAARVTAQLPAEWLGHPLHLYAFLRDSSGRTSDTLYHPLPV